MSHTVCDFGTDDARREIDKWNCLHHHLEYEHDRAYMSLCTFDIRFDDCVFIVPAAHHSHINVRWMGGRPSSLLQVHTTSPTFYPVLESGFWTMGNVTVIFFPIPAAFEAHFLMFLAHL